MKLLTALLSLIFLVSCNNTITPKPHAYLNLSYPKSEYQKSNSQLPCSFKYSKEAILYTHKNLWLDLHYPNLKADFNLTYQEINHNLPQLISDAEKLTYRHTIKANNIEMNYYEDNDKKVYAKLFEISGNVASYIQFQATDSTKHFLSGALYFNVKPNFDSIVPAIEYVKKDIEKLIETLEWKN